MTSRKLLGKIVAATHNKGKLVELRELLGLHGLEVIGAGELDLPEPEETGDTFYANALIKARSAAERCALPCLADDSGLCVDALGGAPGIYSARWATNGDFAAAMQRTKEAIDATGATPPFRAYFVSVLAICWPDGNYETFEGRVYGDLLFPPRGAFGFGYDPCFRPDGHDRTFGEMTSPEKHGLPKDGSQALSHRARAFQLFEKACL